ncbi:glycosyltransferase [Hymenobacter busanensis]|uniref:Glycosyltransferase n=1 Tax=Hymenobacter busanensis TaxID=2607656 RepID=A0A7L4ZXF5_9BACT|nr:glycosyltransferase [Hymenobacter busanensis]KAA9325290.1 glycosyltransferase [Hymenobacter busanensis]QHJ07717.1 glycosyltransferase [Hymenobacter busanensis]
MPLPLPARFLQAIGASFARAPRELQIPAPPAAELEICVIVPAKDEADRVEATLLALAQQVTAAGQPFAPERYEILLLANNCSDDTAAVARRFAARHPHLALHVLETTLPPAEAHVGRARRLLMDAACRRLEAVGRPLGLIASTDADTRVAATWLAATLAEVAAGADAVGGRILPETTAPGCPTRRLHLRDAAYRLLCARLEVLIDPLDHDPWPRHHQHFGGSLTLTAAAYRRVGGLPVVPFLEDEALCRLLRHHDLRLRHSPHVRVVTSARQQGRVAVGLSWQLREWAQYCAEGREPLVDNPVRLLAEWTLRRQLRQLWQFPSENHAEASGRVLELAAALNLTPTALLAHLGSGLTFGTMWEQLMLAAQPAWQLRWPALPLSAATAELRKLVAVFGR